MASVTEADVVREAIEVVGKGFTSMNYFQNSSSPGPEVGATCAIGGVEQAIWRLTGKDVSGERYWSAKPAIPKRRTLYARVMKQLNAKACELYGHLKQVDGDPIETVEDVTFTSGTETLLKRRVLRVFRSVLAELESPTTTTN